MKSIPKLLSMITTIILFTGNIGVSLADLEQDEYEMIYNASGSITIGGGRKADKPFYITSPNSYILSFEGSEVNTHVDFHMGNYS
jgi:hypothetical protein